MSTQIDPLHALFGLHGKTALITGGTRGIGQSMTIALASAGADIILIQRNDSNRETHDKVVSLGRKCTIYSAELSDKVAVGGIVKGLVDQGHSMDILLNCAGIQRRHKAEEFPTDEWEEVSHSLFALVLPFYILLTLKGFCFPGSFVCLGFSRDVGEFGEPTAFLRQDLDL